MAGRLAVLLGLFGRGAVRRAGPAVVALAAVAAPMLAVRWTGAGLELWGVAFGSVGDVSREDALGGFLREFLSWWWLAVAVGYLLPGMLLPAAAGFSYDQVLWLRMTPCSARELALARAWRVVLPLALLAAVGLPAAVGASAWHGVPAGPAVRTVAGLLAHGLWAGGLLLAVGPALRSPADRALGAFVAFLVPVVSFLVFAAVEPKLAPAARRWWPFTAPFADLPSDPLPHALAAAGLGAAGVVFSVAVQPGHRRPPAAPEGGS